MALNFETGRYSACKSCRTTISNFIQNVKKEKIKKEIREEKIKVIDPEENLRWIVEDTIKIKPMYDGQTLIKSIKSIDDLLSETMSECHEKFGNMQTTIINQGQTINTLSNSIIDLKTVILNLQKEITELKINYIKMV